MDNRKTSKIETVQEKRYQFNKVDARTACWLFTFLSAKTSRTEGIATALGKCTRTEYDEIQTIALRSVFHLDNQDGTDFPTAVITSNGSWTNPSYAQDSGLILELTSLAIFFNLEPFLVEDKSNSLK